MMKPLFVAAAAAALFATIALTTQAADEPRPVVNTTLIGADQLKQWKGKRLMVVLESGKELEGTVGNVTSNNVELKALSGKDYFDALVKIDEIAAVVYRVKE